MIAIALKTCSACSRDLPADADHFYRGSGVGGLLGECKECFSKNRKLRLVERKKDPAEAERLRLANNARVIKHNRSRGVQPKQHAGPTKVCPCCKLEKDREQDFYWAVSQGKHKALGYCKSCCATKQKARHWTKRLVDATQNRHKVRWEEAYDLTPEYLQGLYDQQDGRCAWLGIPLRTELGGSFRHPNQVSLDRVDGRKGYTRDNVLLVCQAANLARCDAPMEVFEDFILSIKRAR
jgi:hypothetical protein